MDEILELRAPSLGEYYGAPFILAALLGLIFVVRFRRLGLVTLFLVVPFVYLGLSGRRFVFLLGIVAGPVLARYLSLLMGRLSPEWARSLGLPAALLSGCVTVALTGLVLARVEPFIVPQQIPGFGVNYDPYPEGALRYLDRNGLTGRLYNPFEWGGYIVWRDFPRRIPIIDGRAHVPSRLLDPIHTAPAKQSSMKMLQVQYGFNVAVVNYPRGIGATYGKTPPDKDLGLTSPDWALVYWDDISLVYLKRTDDLAEIIKRDEYLHVKPANGIEHVRLGLQNQKMVASIEAELLRNVAETESSTAYMSLGIIYLELGYYDKAIDALDHVRDFPFRSHIHSAYLGLAFAHKSLGRTKQAISYYEKAAQIEETPMILYDIGAIFQTTGNYAEAIRYFERALELDPGAALVYPALISTYQRVGKTERLPMLESAYRNALARSRADKHFQRGLKFYFDGKPKEALIEFQETLRVNPKNAVALSNIGYIYYDQGDPGRALALQQQALRLDPNYANAHYGLALIYRDWENQAKAIEHFKEYIRLEPNGYWSRQAREELSRLSRRDAG
jgi:tetratricopeptide (TPR) repeat protein